MSGHEQRIGDFRVICDFSGFKAWRSECVKTWDGRIVLRRFVGEEATRNPLDIPPRTGTERPIQDARPEPTDTFLSVGQVTPESL